MVPSTLTVVAPPDVGTCTGVPTRNGSGAGPGSNLPGRLPARRSPHGPLLDRDDGVPGLPVVGNPAVTSVEARWTASTAGASFPTLERTICHSRVTFRRGWSKNRMLFGKPDKTGSGSLDGPTQDLVRVLLVVRTTGCSARFS